jgi:ubiquinone/menaquinone biosynthesis C-methylase UbiE
MRPESSEYAERLRREIERYRKVDNVHDLPAIFRVWADRYVGPKISEVCGASISVADEFYALYISRYAAEHPGYPIRIASIGAGNGDMEVRIAALLKKSGVHRFRFQCMDINPAMLDRGRETARKEQQSAHFEFVETEMSQWSPEGTLDIVMAHHSLHHIEQLEMLFANVRKAIGNRGYFLVCDMAGRNGHMRWPEALEIVDDIWRTMPDRYKYNHQLKRVEQTYENWDCSTEGFEGIRSQDILPLLVRLFQFEAFAAFGNLPDLFVDRSFGHNLSPDNEEDVAFIHRIGELNDRLISEGKIKPTQIAAVMRAGEAKPCKCHLHWTPEFCVRPAPDADGFQKLPLTGCGSQVGPARGAYPDNWITSPFATLIKVEQNLNSLVIEGYLPEDSHKPELTVHINGAELLKKRVGPGGFSLRISCRIPAAGVLVLSITSDKLHCPLRDGTGTDERNLTFLLCGIRVIA